MMSLKNSTPFPFLLLLILVLLVVLSCNDDVVVLVEGASSKTAVVVGAGPSGLATALTLARNHGYSVKILESAKRIDVYDPTKAYPFLIRARGQKCTSRFSDVQEALEAQGIATEQLSKLVAIPADPEEIFDPTPKVIPTFSTPSGTNYWLRRHEFLRVLLDAVNATDNIELVSGVECQSISPLSNSEIQITASNTDDSNKVQNYQASLVIGADGIKSTVRQTLEQESLATVFPKEWINNNPKGFRIKKWMSPASGLKFKTIHMNADTQVPVGDGTSYKIPFGTPTLFAIRSKFTKPNNCVSLGLLPAQPGPTRTFNIIRVPNHDIWKIRDGNELREWFQEAFPRFDFSSGSSLIDQAEFDRFASTEGLSLPPCQYCPELFIASPTKEASVILLGDAASAFPPDLGEGVNSGLEDVACLDDMLTKHETIGDAAQAFANLRKPENKALVKMVRVGAPFQYQQFGGMLTVKKFLWTANFFGRILLHKVTFGLTPLPVFSQIADANVKYSTAMRRADTLTAILWTVAIGVLAKVIGFTFKLPKVF
jgi:kynurenine 3-monooxygenase